MIEKRWITPRECAAYLSIHVKTVYAQVAKREIPSSKIGGSVRIDRKKLDEIMEGRGQSN
ncbi:MAG: helix-turn-helix domain-containing protein [Candidatus Aminicenantes bacterium]|nr:helix-turn-helix domain-containing protein [Candidatus Aminicenantes bacterium]